MERDAGVADRKRDPRNHDPSAVAGSDRGEGVERGVVLVVGSQQLVAGLEVERTQDGIDPGRGVGNEGEPVGIGAEERRHPFPCGIEQPRELPRQEADWLRLHPVSQDTLEFQHLHRAGAVRAVVQERDGRIQAPAEVGLHPDMMRRRTDRRWPDRRRRCPAPMAPDAFGSKATKPRPRRPPAPLAAQR